MNDRNERLNDLKIDRGDLDHPRFHATPALLTVLFLAATALGIWWWKGRAHPLAVEVATATATSAAGGAGSVLDASGYVVARRLATVSSKVTGKIVDLRVEEGMKVVEGQILARLDDAIPRRQLAVTEAQLGAARKDRDEVEVRLAEAELTVTRRRALVEERVASQADLDAAVANRDSFAARLAALGESVVVAERLVALRSQELDDTIIRAPFTGVAVTKDAQPGEMISPVSAGGGFTRTGICTVVDMASLEIEVDVNEAYIHRVRDDQRVTAVLDAYPDWRIPARVITTVPTADRQKATVKVRIGFDGLDPRILPEMGVKVSFLEEAAAETTEQPAPRPSVTVPARAVRKDGEQDVVFVVEGERALRRAITVERVDGDRAVVSSGLVGGERVVVAPPAELVDGAAVEIKDN